ncbi:MAG: hypothetical protein LW688_02515 [Cryomorphaceae bacterium]|jgi:hypothetical protein|nr:hypothetical protein [Cryomorphaceae bacterium]
MLLHEFIEKFDHPGSVILLVGKREVKAEDKEKLVLLGELIAKKTSHLTFRSGNATGADELFCSGAKNVNPSRVMMVLPSEGHRKKHRSDYTYISLDELSILREDPVVYEARKHKTRGMLNYYLDGNRDGYTSKVALILRDAVKVLGHQDLSPATAAIVYNDTEKPDEGGTAFTVRVCRDNDVPVFEQEVWFHWLTEIKS